MEEFIQVLRDHEKTVKEKLTGIEEKQERDHVAEMENFQVFATELKRLVERGEDIFRKGVAVEILQEEHALFAGCKELLSQCQKIELYKPEDVIYVVNRDKVSALMQVFKQPLGEVIETDHSQSVAEGKGLKGAELGAETNFTVTTRDSQGKQFYNEQEQVTVTIRSQTGEEEAQITDYKDGNYALNYKPKTVGRHDVGIEINGCPLTGSPWRVDVKPHQYKVLKSCGSRGKREREFDGSWSITKNENTGNIAVADYGNRRIQLFNGNLEYLGTTGNATIGHPTALAYSKNGDLIVTHEDLHSKKLSVITERGQFIEQFSKQIIKPHHVFVKTDADGHVVVCDEGDKKIKVLSPDGKELLQSFGAPDCDVFPSFACFHNEMFFVSYMRAHCVKVFNKEGTFLYDIGSQGSGVEQLRFPEGVAVDAFNNLIVCDVSDIDQGLKYGALKMFTLDGQFLTSFCEDMIEVPWIVTVCKNGDLLVTDLVKHWVHILQ